jgi:elongation factor Ts
MVKALREKTGLPMMDCKAALVEAGGDEAKAIDVLRKKGAGKIEKMADREAGQGRLACVIDDANKRGALVEVRCETAPVAKTDDFIELCNQIARHAAAAEAPTPQSLPDMPLIDDPSRKLRDYIAEVFNRLRENIQIARVAKMTGHLARYIHHDGQKGCLVEFSGAVPGELAGGVCMHVTAINPSATNREEIDSAAVEKERELARESVKDKPANIIDKIVGGKLDKWFAEIVLLEQAYVLDDKKSVGAKLKEVAPDLTVKRFARFQVGAS